MRGCPNTVHRNRIQRAPGESLRSAFLGRSQQERGGQSRLNGSQFVQTCLSCALSCSDCGNHLLNPCEYVFQLHQNPLIVRPLASCEKSLNRLQHLVVRTIAKRRERRTEIATDWWQEPARALIANVQAA